MMKCKLSRIEGGTALRTDSVEGVAYPPRLGEPFCLVGEGFEFGMRFVSTSPVESLWPCEEGEPYRFRTQSGSLYEVECLD